MENQGFMQQKNKWFWISPVIFGTAVLTIIRLITDIPQELKFWERPLYQNIIELVSLIIISYAIEFCLQRFIQKRKAKIGQMTFKSLTMEYFLIMLSGLIVTIPCLYIIHFFIHSPVSLTDVVIAEISLSLLLVIYYSIFRGGDLLQAYVAQKTLIQQIKNTQMEAELKFLKAQFHPHFLFNALNAIYFQIDEENEAPRKSIEQLSELLRYQLYDINQTVRIEQELNFIGNYIEFQKVRMKESFRLTVYFDSLLKDQKIHPLLLFPLVENAYKYVGGEYWITIEARLLGSRLCFTVANAVLPIQPTRSGGESGVGLENLNKRLDWLYPEKYRMETKCINNTYTVNLMIEW
jgi:two-component system, LytTR family, sensor kinase